ncbi:hypothetical protein AAF712_016089 [Marasmius tenuissimus]|uniref:Uncharacterized protein n=1 Tax=Marasmius tenuissimus TaxID=585030 RepID=A0ABR2Z7R0_9AGAR
MTATTVYFVSRTPDQTVEAIHKQIKLACRGDKEGVKQASTLTGVKDKLSQYWINILLDKATALREVRLKNRGTRDPQLNLTLTKEEQEAIVETEVPIIGGELWEWIILQPPSSLENLPEDHPAQFNLWPGVYYNTLLGVQGIDPHKDTLVKILHTWSLGNEKYVWHGTHTEWSKEQEALFSVRLQSSDIDGLSIPSL